MAKIQSISKKDIKKINAESNLNLNPKSNTKIVDDKYLYSDGKVIAFQVDGKYIPTLKSSDVESLKKATIDMNAIPFMIKGADLMRPGITKLEDFEKGDIILIIDEKYSKGICICQSLFSSGEIQEMEKGKVMKNLHWVGDEIWQFSL